MNENHEGPVPDRAPAADFLRVASVLLIAWYHFWQQSWLSPNFSLFGLEINMYPVVSRGYMFVYLMLLISGFVLTLGMYQGRYPTRKSFYLGRARRILPSYLLCLIVFFFFDALPNEGYSSSSHMLIDISSHLTFTQNLFYESYSITRLNGALWTLAVEVQFYLIFPLLIKAFRKKPLAVYAAMLGLCLLCKLYVHRFKPDTTLFINRLPVMLDVYANGMLAAWGDEKLKKQGRLKWLHLILALAACAGMYLLLRHISYVSGHEEQRRAQMWAAFPFSALGGVFLLCGSLSFRAVRLAFSNPVIVFLSGISYNFYIWHQAIAVRLKQGRLPSYTGDAPNVEGQVVWQHRYMFMCFAMAFLVSAVLTYLVEKPCAAWLRGQYRKCENAKKRRTDA